MSVVQHGVGCHCEICIPLPRHTPPQHAFNCQCQVCITVRFQPTPNPIPPSDHAEIMHTLRAIEALIISSEKRTMAGLNDINTGLDALAASLSTQLTAIQTEISQLAAGGADPVAVQAIVDRIGALKVGVDATITQLAADDPAPPAPVAPSGSAASVP